MSYSTDADQPFWKGFSAPIAIPHRGGGASFGKDKYRKENTIEAFEATVRLGYSFLEMDVIATADKQVVVMHVARNMLDRLFYGKNEAPTYPKLEKLTYKDLIQKMNRQIPTLEQVLLAFPGNKFLIDAKTDNVVKPLAHLIRELKAQNRVCIGSFYPHRIEKLQQILGENICSRIIMSKSPLDFIKQWRFLRSNKQITAADLYYLYTNRLTVNYLHKKGLKVLTWTVNDEKQIKRCLELGADGIMSDKPELLKKIILEKNPENKSLSV